MQVIRSNAVIDLAAQAPAPTNVPQAGAPDNETPSPAPQPSRPRPPPQAVLDDSRGHAGAAGMAEDHHAVAGLDQGAALGGGIVFQSGRPCLMAISIWRPSAVRK